MVIDQTLYIPITACPLCDSQESEIIRTETNKFYSHNEEEKQFLAQYAKDPINLMRCQNCHFCYVDKLPKDAIFFQTIYSFVKYDYEYEYKYHGKKEIYHDIKRQLSRYRSSGSLLDVGTWCGTLLGFMSDTYSTVGCEISEPAANYGRSIGLDIQINSFDSANFNPESFDVITIIDVLEHLPQPRNVLNKIHTLLKPGGVLYIKVPNIQAQINKQNLLQNLNLSTEGVCQNYVHINHFNHQSLKTSLISLGFEVVEMGYTKPEIWDLNFPEPTNVKIKKWTNNQVRKIVTTMLNSISYLSNFDLGFNIYVIARKA